MAGSNTKRRGKPPTSAGEARTRQCVLYARVSSKEQEKEGYSIPAQLRYLRHYAAAQGLHIVREFVDIETAKRAGRANFKRMVSFLELTRSCQAVIAEKTDRLYRNFKDYVTLDDLGIEIHLPMENQVVTPESGSSDKLVHRLMVVLARHFLDNLSEETRKGMCEKATEGIWPSFAPVGYRNTLREDGKRVIEPDPATAPAVVRMFEAYATGDYSIKDMAALAAEAGLTSRRSGSPIRKSTVHKMLRNPIYAGSFEWKGVMYDGIHTPLVSRAIWESVQRMLDDRPGGRRRRRRHEFAFTGLIRCRHCGCALVGQIQKGRYVYYHCSGQKGNCGEPYAREEAIQKQFEAILGQLKFDEQARQWVVEALKRSHKSKKSCSDEEIRRLQERYAKLEKRIERMYEDKLDGRIDTSFFERKHAEWRTEQNRILARVKAQQEASRSYVEDGVLILELAKDAQRLFKTQTPQEKRRLLQCLLSNCEWGDGHMSASFRQPFAMLAVAATKHRRQKAAGGLSDDLSAIWRPQRDSNPCCRRERAVSWT